MPNPQTENLSTIIDDEWYTENDVCCATQNINQRLFEIFSLYSYAYDSRTRTQFFDDETYTWPTLADVAAHIV